MYLVGDTFYTNSRLLFYFQWRARLLEAQNIINQEAIEDTANAAKRLGGTSNMEESLPLMVCTCSSKPALSLS
jgi:hypothetical protein